MIRSPLRYPGGKSRAAKYIASLIPPDVDEYREPFVGGASVFLYLKQNRAFKHWWISDINRDLMIFWSEARKWPNMLENEIQRFLRNYPDRRVLYDRLKDANFGMASVIAARFFILNRMTFSGTTEAGGYSPQAAVSRLTESSIQRIMMVSGLLGSTIIQCGPYEVALRQPGNNVLLYLDPPYSNNAGSKLYGKGGKLHTEFNHEMFADTCRYSPHRWLITYDDSPYIRDLFSFAHITPFSLQYGMNNSRGKAAAGKEVVITNYEVK